MSNILDHINIFESKNHAVNNFSVGVYLWYFPVRLRYKKKKTEDALSNYFSRDYLDYSKITEIDLFDKSKNMRVKVSAGNESDIFNLKFKDGVDSAQYSLSFHELLMQLSIFNKPLYIGKVNRFVEGGRSKRIEEHLNGQSKFSEKIKEKLKNQEYSNININNLLIMTINLENVFSEDLNQNLEKDFDIALFIEKILIKILKPIYNEVR